MFFGRTKGAEMFYPNLFLFDRIDYDDILFLIFNRRFLKSPTLFFITKSDHLASEKIHLQPSQIPNS